MDSGTQLEKLREVVKTIEDVDGAVPAALAAMPTDGLLNVASQVKMLIDAIPDTMGVSLGVCGATERAVDMVSPNDTTGPLETAAEEGGFAEPLSMSRPLRAPLAATTSTVSKTTRSDSLVSPLETSTGATMAVVEPLAAVEEALPQTLVQTGPAKATTIGQRFGYPAPPPLSTYNGKIGRSFYTSAYNASTPILPNSQVAYSSNQGSEWILCRVLKVLTETRFEIQDPEPDESHPHGQIFRAHYKQVILVPVHLQPSAIAKLKTYKVGMRVLAKYPETTTFYKAEVVSNDGDECLLQFEGEEEAEKTTRVHRAFVLPCPK